MRACPPRGDSAFQKHPEPVNRHTQLRGGPPLPRQPTTTRAQQATDRDGADDADDDDFADEACCKAVNVAKSSLTRLKLRMST
eukprot:CAMPEP_0171854442 /NCGR_PEP_ID=MMETSP0992-20121227/22877_1 /TAXON_ID=483369 /ORGANISM="non described non described, Strain CCMP2098" /LENGTH=82 /DNA_ID=CAMNT_0012475049 /DNA_START=74 /DNA_END=322 /DNA_ORIENTATION=-